MRDGAVALQGMRNGVEAARGCGMGQRHGGRCGMGQRPCGDERWGSGPGGMQDGADTPKRMRDGAETPKRMRDGAAAPGDAGWGRELEEDAGWDSGPGGCRMGQRAPRPPLWEGDGAVPAGHIPARRAARPRQPRACARRGRPPWRWGGSEDHIAASGSELPVAGCQAVIIVSVTIAEAVAN